MSYLNCDRCRNGGEGCQSPSESVLSNIFNAQTCLIVSTICTCISTAALLLMIYLKG